MIDVTEILTHPRAHPGCHATVEGGLYSAPWRLDAACARALAAGDPSYRTVKGVLAAGLERVPLPQLTLTSPSATAMPALLRGPDALVGHLPAGDPARIATATAASSALPPVGSRWDGCPVGTNRTPSRSRARAASPAIKRWT